MSQNSALSLLFGRRFGFLFAAQFLGVVADNLAKTAVAVLLVLQGADGSAPALATAMFIVPYALFASVAGAFADRLPKSRAAKLVKAMEIPVMAFAGLALWTGNPLLLMAAMFFAGVQATFFSPVKYGILPELVGHGDALVSANAWIESGTFIGILGGTIGGGLLASNGDGLVAFILLAGLSATGWLLSLAIPATTAGDKAIRLSFMPLAGARPILRELRAWPKAHGAAVGLSWFWMCGAILLSTIPVYARDILSAGPDTATILLAALAFGIGAGSMSYGPLARTRLARLAVPGGLAGMGLAIAVAACASAEPEGLWLGAGALFVAAACGGFASIPLYVALQEGAPAESRSRAVAANNLLNAIYMVAGTVLSIGLTALGGALGAGPAELVTIVLLANALLCLLAAARAWLNDPAAVIAVAGPLLYKLYHIEVHGAENLDAAGERAVIVPNHVTWLDGILLAACLTTKHGATRPAFAINTQIAQRWWARWAVNLIEALPIDPTNPMALKTLIKEVRGGRRCVIFPEGRLTRTGTLMKIYDGPAVIADRADAQVVPVRIDGAEQSIWTRLGGVYHRRLRPRITITILAPRRIQPPAGVMGRARREFLARALYDVMEDAALRGFDRQRTLFTALLDAARNHGAGREILEDMERTPISYRRLLLGACVVGRALTRRTAKGETVGLLLPNTNAFAVGFFALQAFGRVPALLNYSTGIENLAKALGTACITTVVTSRRFVTMGKLEAAIERLSQTATILYLEDLREGLTRQDKLRGLVDRWRARHLPGAAATDPASPAVVLFTSGSEGVPKGVVLSHAGLLANAGQARARIDFTPLDVTLNAMPCFHSFGLTIGFLLPLFNGLKSVLYPNPLHYRRIPELAYDCEATILFGTDTFLTGYARMAHAYDFRSVRYIFAGAERIREETRRVFADRFGVRVLEGYGATEAGPVIAINTAMYAKSGTVGRLMPGMTARLEPVPGIEKGGRLFIRGPNIMLGYFLAAQPGQLQPPPDGWYDTGDIVDIDAGGFITILGRAKRFAKVAGEMVSLTAVEDWASQLWPDATHAAVALPDARRGERVVLLTTKADAKRSELADFVRARRLPEIAIPATVTCLDAIPALGTGKTDYVAATALVAEEKVVA